MWGPCFGGPWMMVFPLIGLGMFGFMLYMMFVRTNPSRKSEKSKTTSSDDSLHILKTRLARGEISEEEYNRLKQALEQD